MAQTKYVVLGIGCGCGAALLAVFGCLAGIFGLAWFGIGIYKDVTKSADDFLAQIASGDIPGAYQSASTVLRASQSEPNFTRAAKHLGLTEYQSTSWNVFDMKNDDATIEGTMTKKSGATIQLTMKLVKESGKWKVVSATSKSVIVPTKIATTPVKDLKLPNEDTQKSMALTSLTDFNKAVQQEDFTEFYNKSSETWKAETTPAEILKVFEKYIANKVDFGTLVKSKMMLKDTEINEYGVLELNGTYPLSPTPLKFTLRYMHESDSGAWKLVYLRVYFE